MAALIYIAITTISVELIDPVTGDDCSYVKLYYGEKRPYYVYQTIIRIAIESEPPYEDKLRLYACNIGADAVIFVHRVGLEVSGIALRKWSRLKELNLAQENRDEYLLDHIRIACMYVRLPPSTGRQRFPFYIE